MSDSQWHKFYRASIATTPDVLFDLLADMPNYGRWLPGSAAFGSTTDVDPYSVRLGSRYHDGKPGEQGKDWWGRSLDSSGLARWISTTPSTLRRFGQRSTSTFTTHWSRRTAAPR
jgi:hypothetical protein